MQSIALLIDNDIHYKQ